MTQIIYKVGEAAGQVLAGLCPGKNVEQSGEIRVENGGNDAKINRTADQRTTGIMIGNRAQPETCVK